jgi:hypothetical protein
MATTTLPTSGGTAAEPTRAPDPARPDDPGGGVSRSPAALHAGLYAGANGAGAPAPAPAARPHGLTRVREAVALTFDDVLLAPRHAQVHPKDVSTASRFTRGISLTCRSCRRRWTP